MYSAVVPLPDAKWLSTFPFPPHPPPLHSHKPRHNVWRVDKELI